MAEHIYALHCLIDYFLPLENPEGNWNAHRIHLMAQYYDIDEIETGDKISFKKTQEDRDNEKLALETVIKKLPEHIQSNVSKLLSEYGEQESYEARFVKALDKLEPVFHMYDDNGSAWLKSVKATRQMHMDTKEKYLEGFPILQRVSQVMGDHYEKEGFYYTES